MSNLMLINTSVGVLMRRLLSALVCFWSSIGDMDGDAFDNVILSTERLSNFRLQESDKGKSPEGFRDLIHQISMKLLGDNYYHFHFIRFQLAHSVLGGVSGDPRALITKTYKDIRDFPVLCKVFP